MVLKLIIKFGFIFTFGFIYSQSNTEIENIKYIQIEKKNNQLKVDISKDSLNNKFSILKYKFRTKKLQNEYLKNLKLFDNQENFYINFIGFKKPNKVINLNKKFKIHTIVSLSKNTLSISNSTKVFFLEKINCETFNVYETYMIFEE